MRAGTKSGGWKQLWRKNAVVVAIALFVCAAVYLNWNYEQQAQVGKTLGQSTMVGGKWLMRDRVILTLDEEAILKEACARGAAIYDRAGIKLPDRFPVVKV